MNKRIQLVALIFFCFVFSAFGENASSNKKGKTLKTINSHQKKVTVQMLDNVLKGVNNFLSIGGITPKKAPGRISKNQVQKNPLPNSKKIYNLPSFGSIQNGVRNIKWDINNGTPRFIEVKPEIKSPKTYKLMSTQDAAKSAMSFLVDEKSLLKIDDPKTEFSLLHVKKDKLGMTHVKYKQVYMGIEVWAKEIYIHLDRNGNVLTVNGGYAPTPSSINDLNTGLNAEKAKNFTLQNLAKKTESEKLAPKFKKLLNYTGPEVKKVIWFDNMQIPHLVWLVEIRSSINQDWYYFVDANTGALLNSYNNICYDGATTGSGIDLNGDTRTFGTYQVGADYYLADASEPMFNPGKSQIPENPVGVIMCLDLQNHDVSAQNPFTYVQSPNNQWNDQSSISAHFNALQTYKYYYQTFNRNSIDDSGMTIYSVVHVTENNQPMENAFWNGYMMCYGDGGTYFKPLAGGLDVAAHEMTHGVTQHTAALVYQNQSGALNESFSDVFGSLVDSTNWTMGEKIILDLNTYPSGAMRDMENPHNGGTTGAPCWQPEKMSEFFNTTQDNGGVHINSGIPNHAFYLVATAIGRHKAGSIWYRALTKYLTRSSQFIDARIATVQAAKDLYGDSGSEVNAVKAAWDGVEVNEGSGTPPPPSSQLNGDDWILAVNTDPSDPNSIYMVNPVIQSNSDIQPLSVTPVLNRPAVTDTSGIIVFVDTDHNLRGLYANPVNPQEQYLDTSRIWESVAIGPGFSSIALTTYFIDTTIYYVDVINQTITAFKLKSQSFDGPDVNTALYADEMSFDPTGQYILFDTYNEVKSNLGGKISYWNINLLDVISDQIMNVFPSLPAGRSVGNPSFSKTSYYRFTFDYLNDSSQTDYVMTMDFNSGNIGVVAGPLPDIGYPTYSKDDRTIAYHALESDQINFYDAIEKMTLESDMLNGTGNIESYLLGATYPVWFVIGNRITDVEDNKKVIPEKVELMQNYPNPFNPVTIIRYTIPKSNHVSLKIYDILGNEVATLVDGLRPAGSYEAKFNAENISSGVYFYKLQTGSFRQVKKMILVK